MTRLVLIVSNTTNYWHCVLCLQYRAWPALDAVYAVQYITGLVLCVCRYSTALVLCTGYAGQYVAGLVLCVCNTVRDQTHAQCMQCNTLLALYSVYATQLVTSLILCMCYNA